MAFPVQYRCSTSATPCEVMPLLYQSGSSALVGAVTIYIPDDRHSGFGSAPRRLPDLPHPGARAS